MPDGYKLNKNVEQFYAPTLAEILATLRKMADLIYRSDKEPKDGVVHLPASAKEIVDILTAMRMLEGIHGRTPAPMKRSRKGANARASTMRRARGSS